MENKKKPVYRVLLALNLVLLAAAFVVVALIFTKSNVVAVEYIQTVIYLIAILSGFLYAFNQYKKNAAKYYKGFMLLFCLESLLIVIFDLILSKSQGATSSISGVLSTVVCVNLFTLSFAKDLGKKNSLGFAFSVLGVSLINSIRLLVLYPNHFTIVGRAITDIALACVVCLFVIEKYADKAERGTK